MSNKAKKNTKGKDVVFHLSSEENTLRQMPKYNGYACGNGVHGDLKYNRNREKRNWKKELGI